MEGKSAFRVDTKGICFLCLEEVVDHTERSYSYRTLSRYLRLDHGKIYNWKMDGNDSSLYGDALKKTEFMVSLCPECFHHTTSFSDLVQDLEVIKMKLLRSVQRIHDVISESNQEGSRMERCKQRMVTPNPVDILQIGIVENLRKETVKQCELELKKGINSPQVILSRKEVDNFTPSVKKRKKSFRRVISSESEFEEEKQDSFTDPTYSRSSSPDIIVCEEEQVDTKCIPRRRPSSSKSNSGSTTSTNSMSKNGLHRRKSKCKRTKDASKETESSERTSDPSSNVLGDDSFIDDLLNVRSKQKKSTKTPPASATATLSCKFCSRIFPDSATRSLHTIEDHSHLLFSFVKIRSLSDNLFKTVVQHAFELLMKDEHQDDELENETGWKCQFCDWSTQQTNKSETLTVHRHLVDKHFAKICVELSKIQRDQDLLKMLKSKVNGVFVCEACNASFKLKYHLRRHQLKHCTVLTKEEPTNVNKVEDKVHLVNDEVASHSGKMVTDSSEASSTSSEADSESDSQEKAELNKKTKPSGLMKAPKLMPTPKSTSSINVIIVSPVEIERKKPKFKCDGCGVGFLREGNFERHKQFTCPGLLKRKSENSSVVESNENEIGMDEDEPLIDNEELLKLQNEGNNLLQLPEEFEVKPDVSSLLIEAEYEEDYAPLVDENEEPCWRSVLVPKDLMGPNPLDECKPNVDVENGGVVKVQVEDEMMGDQKESVETVGSTNKTGNVVSSEPPEVLHEIQDSDIIVDDVRIDVSQNMIIDPTTAEATASCFRDFSGKPVIKRCADAEGETILPNSPMEDSES